MKTYILSSFLTAMLIAGSASAANPASRVAFVCQSDERPADGPASFAVFELVGGRTEAILAEIPGGLRQKKGSREEFHRMSCNFRADTLEGNGPSGIEVYQQYCLLDQVSEGGAKHQIRLQRGELGGYTIVKETKSYSLGGQEVIWDDVTYGANASGGLTCGFVRGNKLQLLLNKIEQATVLRVRF